MNKNQKRIRKMVHTDGDVTISVPAGGYHNNPKGVFVTRNVTKHGARRSRRAKVAAKRSTDGMSLMEQARVFNGVPKAS